MKEEIQFILPCSGYHPFVLYLCGYSYCDKTYKIDRPHSDVACFEYVLDGCGTVCTNGQTFHPAKGDIYMLYQGDDQYYYSDPDTPWTKVWFNFSGELAAALVREYGLSDVHLVHDLNLLPEFEEMIALARTDYTSQEIYDQGSQLFLRIVQKISRHLQKGAKAVSQDALRLRDYIHRNIEKNITTEELSHLIFRSQSQTARIFKKAFGVNPYEYILYRKMETAKHLLLSTQMKVKDIAAFLSFSDEHYFSNCFKQKIGMSPRQYREHSVHLPKDNTAK